MRADRGRRGPPLRGGAAVPPGWWCAARPRGEGAAPAAAALAHTRRLRRGRNPPTPFPRGARPTPPTAAAPVERPRRPTPTRPYAPPPLRAATPTLVLTGGRMAKGEARTWCGLGHRRSFLLFSLPPARARPAQVDAPFRLDATAAATCGAAGAKGGAHPGTPRLPSPPVPAACRGFRWRRHTGWAARCLRGGGERCHGDRRGCSATASVDGFDVRCISGGVSCAGLGRGGAAAAAGCGTDASAPLKAQGRAVGSPLAAATRW